MTIYCFLIAFCSIVGYILDRAKKEKDKKIYIFVSILPFLALFFVSAIRYNVGTDYAGTYTELYYAVLNNYKRRRIDIGFYWLLKAIVFCDANLQMVFVTTSLIINYFVYKTIQKESKSKALSYYIYICSTFYFFTMNGIRKSIAMALFYYSLYYANKKNIKKYMLLNIIGALFHLSALIFIPLYFVFNLKNKKKKKFVITLILTYIMSATITPVLVKMLSNTKYNLYFMHNNYSALQSFNLSSITNLLLMIFYIIFTKKDDNIAYILFVCHWMGAEISVFLTSIPLTLRLFESFRFIDFISVPYLISGETKLNKKWIRLLIIILYFAYFIYHIGINNANSVLPYQTIWKK